MYIYMYLCITFRQLLDVISSSKLASLVGSPLWSQMQIAETCTCSCGLTYTVKPPNKGHFGDNINSAVLSLVERFSPSQRFLMHGNYMDSNILGLEAVSLVERSNIQCPFLGVSFIRGSTVNMYSVASYGQPVRIITSSYP